MKKLILVIALLLLPLSVYEKPIAFGWPSVGVVASGGGCNIGSTASETFDDAGDYDYTYPCGAAICWETEDETNNGDVDPNAACPSAIGFDGECLETDGGYVGGQNSDGYVIFDLGSELPVLYFREYIFVDANSTLTASDRNLIDFQNDAYSSIVKLILDMSGADLVFAMYDGTLSTGGIIYEDVGYLFEFYSSDTANQWEWKVNGVTQEAVARDPGDGIRYIVVGTAAGTDYRINLFHDKLDVGTTRWIGGCP